MKNWYSNTSTGQRIFLYVVAVIVAFCGFVVGNGNGGQDSGSPAAFLLMLPLAVLIYLSLGKKTPKPE
jgi:hypothetical protein